MQNDEYSGMTERRLMIELNKKLDIIVSSLKPTESVATEFNETNPGSWMAVSGPVSVDKPSFNQPKRQFKRGCGAGCACKSEQNGNLHG